MSDRIDADVKVRDVGTFWIFLTLTEKAKDWVEEFVHLVSHQRPPGREGFICAHRDGGEIVEAMRDDGLDVRPW